MKRLLQVGPDQPDDIRTRLIEALREPVDAIAKVIRRAQDALAYFARDAGARRESARYRRAGDARTSRDVGRGHKGPAQGLPAHSRVLPFPARVCNRSYLYLHTCASGLDYSSLEPSSVAAFARVPRHIASSMNGSVPLGPLRGSGVARPRTRSQ